MLTDQNCFTADRCSHCQHCGRLHVRLGSLQENMEDWLNCLVMSCLSTSSQMSSKASHPMESVGMPQRLITSHWAYEDSGGCSSERIEEAGIITCGTKAPQVVACFRKNAVSTAATHHHVRNSKTLKNNVHHMHAQRRRCASGGLIGLIY